jgi:hypothetical protein
MILKLFLAKIYKKIYNTTRTPQKIENSATSVRISAITFLCREDKYKNKAVFV